MPSYLPMAHDDPSTPEPAPNAGAWHMRRIEHPAPGSSGDHLRLELDLYYGEDGLSGSVGPPEGPPTAFAGWIGLLGALDHLRRHPQIPTASLPTAVPSPPTAGSDHPQSDRDPLEASSGQPGGSPPA